MTKALVVRTPAEAEQLAARLVPSAERMRSALARLVASEDGALRLLSRLKFEAIGCDPLDCERPLNVIEQLNQTLTYQASFAAAAWLLRVHAEHAPLALNLGTAAGTDIASHDGQLVAEVFAAVDPRNNRKLANDIDRLRPSTAPLRYVLYISPSTGGRAEHYEVDGIRVRRLAGA